MEFLQTSRRRNIFGDLMHIALNLALVCMVFAAMYVGQRAEIALILIMLSKWRVFAVRWRYWRVNILANLVDFTVGFGVVALLYLAAGSGSSHTLWLQVGVSIFFALWLVVIKPRTRALASKVQAGTALFVGSWALAAFSHDIGQIATVIFYLGMGYGAARHVLVAADDKHYSLLASVFALVLAELGWATYHWNIGYGLSLLGGFMLPQMAIIALCVGVIAERLYQTITAKASFSPPRISVPVIACTVVVLVLVLFVSSAGPGLYPNQTII